MSKLPTEVLELIFIRLNPPDKLMCMTVCKKWSSIIIAFSLLHTIRLSTQRAADSLITTLHEKPFLRSQVRELFIDTKEPIEINTIIPLLHDIKVLHASSQQELYLNRVPNHRFWQHSIEYLSLKLNSLDFFTPLLKYPCSNLRILVLDGKKIRLDPFFQFLSGAPKITDLHLFNFQLELKLLEDIHSVLKSLYSIKLERSTLLFSELQHDKIRPTTKLKCFHLTYNANGCLGRDDVWTKYIMLKYPKLIDLTFCLSDQQTRTHYVTSPDTNNSALDLLLEKTNKLQRLFIHHKKLPSNLMKMMEHRCHRLVDLSIVVGADRLIIRSVIESFQVLHLKRLNLKNINLSVLPSYMNSMVGLEELVLCFLCPGNTQAILLHDVLALCPPNLQLLKLEDAILYCSQSKIPLANPHDTICHLEFSHVEFCPGVDLFLSTLFLNTKKLVFYKCRFHQLELTFNHFNLHRLEVTKNEFGSGTHLVIKDSKEVKVYTVGYRDSHHRTLRQFDVGLCPIYPPTKVISPSMDIDPFLVLTCRDISNVVVRF